LRKQWRRTPSAGPGAIPAPSLLCAEPKGKKALEALDAIDRALGSLRAHFAQTWFAGKRAGAAACSGRMSANSLTDGSPRHYGSPVLKGRTGAGPLNGRHPILRKGKKMIRNLKTLGLALVAIFAFGAVAVSAASAGALTTEGGQAVTLTATETAGTYDTSFTLPNKVHCPGSTFTGHKATATPHELIPNLATSFTFTPHLVNCVTEEETGSRFSTTVDMNGCDFLITIGAKVNEGTYIAEGHIVCSAGKFIQITQFSSASHALRLCTQTITTTTPTSHVHLTNTPAAGGTKSDLDIAGTFTDAEVHKSGLCGSSTTKAAVMHIDMTVKAVNSVGAQTGISVGL
jgi:hypothetical protein